MAGLERFDDRVWDRFFDFVTPDIVQMSASELDEELRRAGIDTSGAFVRVQHALQARRACEELARARTARLSVTQKLTKSVARPIENARQILHDMISSRAPKSLQPVLFRKLERAATDDDVRSLLEDIQRLEELDAGGDDGKV